MAKSWKSRFLEVYDGSEIITTFDVVFIFEQ
jgi:hypothetical protein